MEMDELCAHLDFVSQDVKDPSSIPADPPRTRVLGEFPKALPKSTGGALPPPRQRGAPGGGSGPELSPVNVAVSSLGILKGLLVGFGISGWRV